MRMWLCGVAALAVAGSVVMGGDGDAGEGEGGVALAPGDGAPALAVTEWVKGEAVEGFEAGRVYVVEMWATWCGPCIRYMPHLTEVQEEHGDRVRVVGVNVFERVDGEARSARVRATVERLGEKMGFAVAIDGDRVMERTWYAAARRRGIPSTFVVDGAGRVAWIGHPKDVEGALEAVLAGEHDVVSARRAYLEGLAEEAVLSAEARRRMREKRVKLQEMYRLHSAGEKRAFYARVREYLGTYLRDDAAQLNAVAWRVVTDPACDEEGLALALRASTRANELTEWKNPHNLDTHARVLFERGDVAGAVEHSRRAVAAAGEDADEALRRKLRRALERYERSSGGG